MRWTWIVVPICHFFAPSAAAQSKPSPKPAERPRGWSDLQAEAERPDPKPKAPAPPTGDGDPYRAPKPVAPEDRSRPRPASATQEITENERGRGPSESVAWMKPWKPRFAVRQVRAEFDVWDHNLGTSYMWDVVLAMGVEDVPVLFDVVIPWTHYDFTGPRRNPETGETVEAHTHIGNPTLGLHGGGVAADVVGFWGGAWVSIPSAKAISTLDAEALIAAFAARNGVEGHRFLPNTVPLRWAFGIEGQLHPFVYLRSDFYSTLYFPNEKLQGSFSIPATFEQIHELEVLSPIGLGGGLRFQSLFNVSRSISASTVHGLEPFFAYQPPSEGPYAFDLFARLGLLFSLNEIPGTNGAAGLGNVVTVRTQVGYRF